MHLKPLQKEKKKKNAKATIELIGLPTQLQTWYLTCVTVKLQRPYQKVPQENQKHIWKQNYI